MFPTVKQFGNNNIDVNCGRVWENYQKAIFVSNLSRFFTYAK